MKVTTCILIFSLLFFGCYSYRAVPKEDYFKREVHSKSKIFFSNNEVIEIESYQTAAISVDSIITFTKDSTRIEIAYSDIVKIQEEKFDFGKTFFCSFWITLLSLLFVGVLLLWASGGIGMSAV